MSLEQRVQEIGKKLLSDSQKYKPAVLSESWKRDFLFVQAEKNPAFKLEMLRLLDVMPVLDDEGFARHVKEYLIDSGVDAGFLGKLGLGVFQNNVSGLKKVMGTVSDLMASGFIVGSNIEGAIKTLGALEQKGVLYTLDLLGEATVSSVEAQKYLKIYDDVMQRLVDKSGHHTIDRFGMPKMNLSIKLSAADEGFDPTAFDVTANRVVEKLKPRFQYAQQKGMFLNIDMEQYAVRDLTEEIFMRLMNEKELKQSEHVGIVVQAYLRDSLEHIKELIYYAKQRGVKHSIRLVKGAYWDYEVMNAQKNDWKIPVFTRKEDTDQNYEECLDLLLSNSKYVRTAVGSHNGRSLAVALALKEKYNVELCDMEAQGLFGMADDLKQVLFEQGEIVRAYAPFLHDAKLSEGNGYLVRRVLENASNQGWLNAQSQGLSIEELLREPNTNVKSDGKRNRSIFYWLNPFNWGSSSSVKTAAKLLTTDDGEFRNYPTHNFVLSTERKKMKEAVEVHSVALRVPLFINGEWKDTGEYLDSYNPSTGKLVGSVSMASEQDLDNAIVAAKNAFLSWKNESFVQRAKYVDVLGNLMSRDYHSLAALLVHEAGKTWHEACGEVEEAIDFCHYYAAQARKLEGLHQNQFVLGEENIRRYEPYGVASVFAPKNFPLAILTGMTVAPVVTGNSAVVKPSPFTPLIAAQFAKLVEEAKFPRGVINYVACDNSLVEKLIVSPDIDCIVFTGSKDIGIDITRKAARVLDGQNHIKRVITEMGGKNGIYVDSSADIDEAVLGVRKSAFGHAGQKCSANSRVLVDEKIYDTYLPRLVQSSQSLRVGSALLAETDVGPITDERAFDKIVSYIQRAEAEARNGCGIKVHLSSVYDKSKGFFVSPAIFEVSDKNHYLAQEEIFGPVLTVLKVNGFEQAIDVLNSTPYALTTGIYTRTPSHEEQFALQAKAGVVYINRPITGAIVQRQPFGGFKLSGTGTMAGGSEYLYNFVHPVTISRNTSRRGAVEGIEEFVKGKM